MLCVFFAFALTAAPAGATEFGIGAFTARALDAEGNPESRAGSHPDRLQIDFALNAEGTSVKDLAFEMPPGLGGAAGAVPECSRELFEKGEEECPAESQVGTIAVKLSGGGETTLPIFELEPAQGEIIAFGSTSGFAASLSMELRPDDLGITFKASDLPEAEISEGHLELWGVPADHQTGTSIPRKPFLTLPTRCGPLVFGLRARSHVAEAPWLLASTETATPLSGCQGLAFEPKLAVQLSSSLADSPTGARIDIAMPQGSDPDGLADAQLKDATVDFPEGVAISPSGAVGITPCTDAQLGLGQTTPASCPSSSRVGTVEFVASGLSEPFSGDIYLGEPRPGDQIRTFIVISGPGGLIAKSVSAMQTDPATGRLVTTLTNLPQLPLSRLTLNIDGGAHALLASPLTCGSYDAAGKFESYGGGAPVDVTAPVAIGADADGSPCKSPPAFSPTLVTSSSVHAAGHPTAISMTLRRRPGEQLTRRFSISLPKGLSAAFGGVESCPDAAAASGACPAASRVGGVVAEVGSGFSPVAIAGDVYAAGAYRQSPLSMVIALHASIGPFDLGTAATRAVVQIDPRTGRTTVVTDPLVGPLGGIPVRIQAIEMSLDRPGAIRNPTSCSPASFDATAEADSGATATATSALPVSGCKKLKFKPSFSMALSGRSELHKDGKPGFRVSAHLRRGDTNLRALHMVLPAGLTFDLSSLGEICPRRDAIAGLCSAKARVGTADARIALVNRPLEGSLYVVQPEGHGLPDLWVSIAASGMHVDLVGRLSKQHGRLATDLVGLPDMPMSAFTMRMRGGRNGTLSLSTAPCAHGQSRGLVSRLFAKGQNGADQKQRLKVKARCT